MKKLLLLNLIAAILISATTRAQGSGPAATQQPANQQPTADQLAAILKDAKEKQVPLLAEKTGLTNVQAEKVVEINFEIRQQMATALRGLSEADRSAKLAELKTVKEKKYSEIPLTAEQINAVFAFYEDMGKNMLKRN